MTSNSLTIPTVNGFHPSATDSPKSIAVSISPTTSSNLHNIFRQNSITASYSVDIRQPRVLHPFATGDLKLLLLENISQDAVRSFQAQGFQVDWYPKAWSENELIEKIGQYHAIGIRSKTKITEKVIKAATKVCLSITYLAVTNYPLSCLLSAAFALEPIKSNY